MKCEGAEQEKTQSEIVKYWTCSTVLGSRGT